jgi:type IV pilus assembly protein PilE
MQRHSGFTLIEMLITMAVIAILAAVALPSYTAYVTRSKIAEATMNLGAMRTKMEQYFQDNRTYVGACAAGTVAPLPGDPASPGVLKYFDITCPATVNPATTYTVQAQGHAGGDLANLILTIDQANVRKTVSVPTGWNMPTSNCWVSKKSGDC